MDCVGDFYDFDGFVDYWEFDDFGCLVGIVGDYGVVKVGFFDFVVFVDLIGD